MKPVIIGASVAGGLVVALIGYMVFVNGQTVGQPVSTQSAPIATSPETTTIAKPAPGPCPPPNVLVEKDPMEDGRYYDCVSAAMAKLQNGTVSSNEDSTTTSTSKCPEGTYLHRYGSGQPGEYGAFEECIPIGEEPPYR